MDQWIVPVFAVVGVLGQWYVGSRASARRDGERDEKLKSHSARILNIEEKRLPAVEEKVTEQGQRVSVIEGRLNGSHHAR